MNWRLGLSRFILGISGMWIVFITLIVLSSLMSKFNQDVNFDSFEIVFDTPSTIDVLKKAYPKLNNTADDKLHNMIKEKDKSILVFHSEAVYKGKTILFPENKKLTKLKAMDFIRTIENKKIYSDILKGLPSFLGILFIPVGILFLISYFIVWVINGLNS